MLNLLMLPRNNTTTNTMMMEYSLITTTTRIPPSVLEPTICNGNTIATNTILETNINTNDRQYSH